MKNINWKVRFKNKTWVIAMLAALFFIIQAVLLVFGITWDYNELLQRLITVVAGVFAFWGLIIDPTTAGTGDSEQAKEYTEPRKDDSNE
ncbi:phage holin [Listeria monocytogenes]|uniref:phage holin n=1 Tax=Listeria TaxID=1637 RepID=UPI000E715B9A|nr:MULTISPECIES: phage holin [Listeria]EAC2922158.1 phage holin [Listeria monocytogenes]EAC5867845.1 phage holin [Listeria monocytogenes]EAC8118514.1 phage holin [Listeria monocytogenes]EAD2103966.1 phage holin [Listeria monocytogenes]EAD4729896.1 phage holin [Listeria monocytogenes]